MYEVKFSQISTLLALDIPGLRKVNLSGLAMDAMPFGNIPDTVEELDLSNNSLKEIPRQLLMKNYSLNLAGNPIECDCWHKDDISALQVMINK